MTPMAREPVWTDGSGRSLYEGDARAPWPGIPGEAACVLFSPPYNVGLEYAPAASPRLALGGDEVNSEENGL